MRNSSVILWPRGAFQSLSVLLAGGVLVYVILNLVVNDLELLKRNFLQTPPRLSKNSSEQSLSPTRKTSPTSPYPRQHVFYIKTHKTGSSTVFSVLTEYARLHDLMPLIGKGPHLNQLVPFDEKYIYLTKGVQKYDMVFNHHIFSQKIFKFLHNDTFVFTSLREPFSQCRSAFWYYRIVFRIHYLLKIQGVDPFTEYLKHSREYETRPYVSFTNNRQSVDLGYNISHSFDDDRYIQEFIKLTDKRLDLVLIMEYFDESIILLKRALQWRTGDVIFVTKNEGPKNISTSDRLANASEQQQRTLHAKFSRADILLYKFFLARFKERMSREIGLNEEVAEFRQKLKKVKDFCENMASNSSTLVIEKGKWTDQVHISRLRCKWLETTESDLTEFLRKTQKDYETWKYGNKLL